MRNPRRDALKVAGRSAFHQRRNAMPNEPKKAKQSRSKPPRLENAQDDHEGSAHDPSEFDVMNPAKAEGKLNHEAQENQ